MSAALFSSPLEGYTWFIHSTTNGHQGSDVFIFTRRTSGTLTDLSLAHTCGFSGVELLNACATTPKCAAAQQGMKTPLAPGVACGKWALWPREQTSLFSSESPKCHFLLELLLLLLLSRFSRVRLGETPQTAAHQAPPSLGLSRQEHWSGLPFPSPVHESEKWKWSRSVVSDSSRPHGLWPTRLLYPWDFPGKSTGVGAITFSG